MIDPEKKKDWIRTGLLVAFFMILALMVLNYVIDSAMAPKPN